MSPTIGRIIGRLLIILLAAGVVAGSVYALSQSAFGAGPGGFPGEPRDGQAQFAGALPSMAPDGSALFLGASADLGRPDGGRGAQSLARGLPELLKNVIIIGFLTGVISMVQHLTRRARRRHTAAA